MKLLILANFDVGLYNFRKELLETLLKQGHQVYISLPMGDRVPLLEELGCTFLETPVDRRGVNPFRDLQLLRRYRKMFHTVRPDQVITYTVKPNIYGGLVARMAGIPYFSNITGLGTAFQKQGFLKRFLVLLYRLALKKANVVFFENAENRQVLLETGIVSSGQACLLPGAGVNLEEYPMAQYPEDTEEIRLLFVGRVMAEKGIGELLEAVCRLHGQDSRVVLDVVGPYEEDYAARMQMAQRTGAVRYHGFQQDVRPFIRQAHCFVLPSYHEGMANTLLECGAMGRPLITSNIHGCLEAVQDGKTGYLCCVRDPGDLYDKLKQFVVLPYPEKQKMALASHDYVAAHFDKRKVVEKTVSVLMQED